MRPCEHVVLQRGPCVEWPQYHIMTVSRIALSLSPGCALRQARRGVDELVLDVRNHQGVHGALIAKAPHTPVRLIQPARVPRVGLIHPATSPRAQQKSQKRTTPVLAPAPLPRCQQPVSAPTAK